MYAFRFKPIKLFRIERRKKMIERYVNDPTEEPIEDNAEFDKACDIFDFYYSDRIND